MTQSTHTVTLGIAQAFYSLAIPNVSVSAVRLVKVLEFNPAGGERNFHWTEFHLKNICEALSLKLVVITLDELKCEKTVVENRIYDVGILERLNRKPGKSIVLAGQVEHISVMRPSVYVGLNHSLLKRYELIRKIFLPLRIRNFYSLSPKGKKGIFFREFALSRKLMDDNRKKIVEFILAKNLPEYSFLARLKALVHDGKCVVIVSLLAEHFGGRKEFNQVILERAVNRARVIGGILLIKNHPSDSHNYKSILNSKDDVTVEVLTDAISRSFPMEILVSIFEKWEFFGTDSTFLVTSAHLATSVPVVFEDTSRRRHSHFLYNVGESRKLYECKEVFV